MIIFNKLGKNDRLGNQLFQIAATLAHAKRMNTHAVFNPWKYQNYFEKRLMDFEMPENIDTILCAKPTLTENQKLPFAKLPMVDNLVLEGHFQSEKYFADHADYVLSHFFPKQGLYAAVKNAASSLIEIEDITAVHVRRTDYLNLGFVFNLLTKNYYDRAIDCMQEKVAHPKFIFFSDDIDWCKRTFGMKHHYSTDNSDIVDLFTMALCKHHIISNSSYSWWGAYLKRMFLNEDGLKDSITIAPKVWFNPESKLHDEDICCTDWIRI